MKGPSPLRLSSSGAAWAAQQGHDPFVLEARRKGYIARSAFKLTHMDDVHRLISKRSTLCAIDLGASPGGWCQVLRERAHPNCAIFGVDLLDLRTAIPNATFLRGDFRDASVQHRLLQELEARGVAGKVQLVTSDMCPNRSGGLEDQQKITELVLEGMKFATSVLQPEGHFVAKLLGSKAVYEQAWLEARRWFTEVCISKPPASRATSNESFLVAKRKLVMPKERQLVAQRQERYGLDDWPGRVPEGTSARRGGRPFSQRFY